MSDRTNKRQTQVRALKDALVAQVWALPEEEVAREARLLGDSVQAAQSRVEVLHLRIGQRPKSSEEVADLDAARRAKSARVEVRRRPSRRPRLVAGFSAPPAAKPTPAPKGKTPGKGPKGSKGRSKS